MFLTMINKYIALICGMAQSVAHWAHNPRVGGSSPSPATTVLEYIPEICFSVMFIFKDIVSDLKAWHVVGLFYVIVFNCGLHCVTLGNESN